ncbi:MAG: sigma 54-interacting transcriptional regulator, partial [Deltaproteobacteria bacterium]|nr:sigma 54-interacting transcriptional regulator [Deltaproteobacteria bacterium]MBW2537050.1 sigma 54-interacting transcriptional regulator [Deltaproteobacteria bacterium]
MGSEDTTQTTAAPRRRELEGWVLHVLFSAGEHPQAALVWPSTATLTIGRSKECSIAFESDPRASRVHATLEIAEGATPRCTIVDSSANGTFVNGERVSRADLNDGDVIRAGDSFVVVRRRGPDTSTAAPTDELVGDSPAMAEVRRTIELVGPTDASVLIVGETGTGKELVARALQRSFRPEGPFVAVNCSAIPHDLAESTLFGHVRGAFSGATTAQPGYFRAADGGVLFLDEVGELPAALQPKLLRALEEKAVVPVGATQAVACDVRVLSATNRMLHEAARSGSFRADLYARIADLTIATPPLRERREDILPILLRALGEDAPPLEADLVDALLLHTWPFNARELVKLAKELQIRGAGAERLELDMVRHRLDAPAPAPTHAG